MPCRRTVFCLTLLVVTTLQSVTAAPEVTAKSVVVMDALTGRVLHEKDADRQCPVASTQKLLTALVILDHGDLDRIIKIDKRDTWVEPSKINIQPGETYSRRTLLRGLLVRSGNDVALALARDNAGSINTFAEKMNLFAWKLGVRNSRFLTPNGLTAEHQYSTARDMAMIARAAYANPLLRDIVKTKKLTWQYNDGHTRTFKNTNRILRKWSVCNGMKTGYTKASGFCLIASGKANGREVICIVLGSTKNAVWTDSRQLLAWALGIAPAPSPTPTLAATH